MELGEDDARSIIEFVRNYIELNSIASNFDKGILKPTKLNKKLKLNLRAVYKPTGAIIWEISTKGTKPIENEIAEAVKSLVDNGNITIFTKDLLNNISFEIDNIAISNALKKNFISRFKDINFDEEGLLIKYGLKESIMLPNELTKNKTKTKLFEELCVRAGLPNNYWKQPNISLYKFKLIKFVELEPGRIIKK
ncbi:MAG: AMMECR1 domain-containing protein [Candidatus Micrarchaeia archaeon]